MKKFIIGLPLNLKRILLSVAMISVITLVVYGFAELEKRYGVTNECVMCGTCVSISPESFVMGDTQALPTEYGIEPLIKEAQAACPVDAIWTNF